MKEQFQARFSALETRLATPHPAAGRLAELANRHTAAERTVEALTKDSSTPAGELIAKRRTADDGLAAVKIEIERAKAQVARHLAAIESDLRELCGDLVAPLRELAAARQEEIIRTLCRFIPASIRPADTQSLPPQFAYMSRFVDGAMGTENRLQTAQQLDNCQGQPAPSLCYLAKQGIAMLEIEGCEPPAQHPTAKANRTAALAV